MRYSNYSYIRTYTQRQMGRENKQNTGLSTHRRRSSGRGRGSATPSPDPPRTRSRPAGIATSSPTILCPQRRRPQAWRPRWAGWRLRVGVHRGRPTLSRSGWGSVWPRETERWVTAGTGQGPECDLEGCGGDWRCWGDLKCSWVVGDVGSLCLERCGAMVTRWTVRHEVGDWR